MAELSARAPGALESVRARCAVAVERVRALRPRDGAVVRDAACVALEALSTVLFAVQGSPLADPIGVLVDGELRRVEDVLASAGAR